MRTIVVNLPAGFDASNTAVPTCTPAQLLAIAAWELVSCRQCPVASQVGQISFEVANPYQDEGSLRRRSRSRCITWKSRASVSTAELGFKTDDLDADPDRERASRAIRVDGHDAEHHEGRTAQHLGHGLGCSRRARTRRAARRRSAASAIEVPAICSQRIRRSPGSAYSRQAVPVEPDELRIVHRDMEADSWEEPRTVV